MLKYMEPNLTEPDLDKLILNHMPRKTWFNNTVETVTKEYTETVNSARKRIKEKDKTTKEHFQYIDDK